MDETTNSIPTSEPVEHEQPDGEHPNDKPLNHDGMDHQHMHHEHPQQTDHASMEPPPTRVISLWRKKAMSTQTWSISMRTMLTTQTA